MGEEFEENLRAAHPTPRPNRELQVNHDNPSSCGFIARDKKAAVLCSERSVTDVAIYVILVFSTSFSFLRKHSVTFFRRCPMYENGRRQKDGLGLSRIDFYESLIIICTTFFAALSR